MIKLLSSVKAAVVLIALLVASSVFATLYPQFNLYGTLWFRSLLVLFCLNLMVCTIKRVPGIIKKIQEQPERQELKDPDINLTNVSNWEEKILPYLKGNGYKIKISKGAKGNVKVLAQRGLLSLIAPHLLHISLIIIFFGGFLSTFGQQDRIMIFVGEEGRVSQEIHNDLTVKLNEFTTLYDQNNAVDNWVSDVEIYVEGNKVTQGTTRVNHPLKYQGIVFYQSAYGYTHLVEISGLEEGNYLIPNGKTFAIGDAYFNLYEEKSGALLRVFQNNRLIKTVLLSPTDKIEIIDGVMLEYLQLHPYTVLAVKTDPGTSVAMVGFLFLTISSMFFWTGRYREVYILFNQGEKLLELSVSCKNKEIRKQVVEDLTKTLEEEI